MVFPPNKDEYKKLVAALDELVDIIKNSENHYSRHLIGNISNLIEAYEERLQAKHLTHG